MSRSNSALNRPPAAMGDDLSEGIPPADAYPNPQVDTDIEENVRVLSNEKQEKINDYHRFGLLSLGCFMCLCSSFSYAFNLISGALQKRYQLTQRDLTNISLVGSVFQYFVIPYAFLYDAVGPIPSTILAIVYSVIGFVCLSMSFSGKINADVVKLCVFNAFTGSAAILFDQVPCVTVVSHFPNRRGPVIALLKCFVGLGSAIVGSIYIAFFSKNVENYFMFLMAMCVVGGILSCIFMRQAPYLMNPYRRKCWSPERIQAGEARLPQYLRQRVPFTRLIYAFAILIFLIIFLPLTTALNAFVDLKDGAMEAFAIVVIIVVVLYFLFWIPTPFDRRCNGDDDEDVLASELSSDIADAPELLNKPVYEEPASALVDGSGAIDEPVVEEPVQRRRGHRTQTEVDFIAPQYQTTFYQNLCTLDLWFILMYLFCIGGTELTVISNARYIMESLSGRQVSDAVASLQTVLNGVGSAIGRLCMAYLEYYTQQRLAPEKRIPLTFALFIPAVFLIIGMILFMTLRGDALLLPYVLVALANGFQAASTVLIARTMYAKDPAKHYNFCFVATTLSVIVMHRFLYGEWYTVQSEKHHQGKTCFVKACTMMPLGVMLGLDVASFGASFFVHIRYSRFCKRVMAERARILAEENAHDGSPDGFVGDTPLADSESAQK